MLLFPTGTGDLATLQDLMNRCEPRLDPSEQQDLTRWGALAAHKLLDAHAAAYDALTEACRDDVSHKDLTSSPLRSNRRDYDALTEACANRASVAECIAALEAADAAGASDAAAGGTT